MNYYSLLAIPFVLAFVQSFYPNSEKENQPIELLTVDEINEELEKKRFLNGFSYHNDQRRKQIDTHSFKFIGYKS